MAYYYKINEAGDPLCMFKGLHNQKIKKSKGSGPKINYDFSKHVLIELLDDSTCESKIWSELGLTNNKNVIHKRIMMDSHRIKCRRAIVVCVNSEEAQLLAHRLSQSMIMKRCICAVVIQDLLSDLCLFEKQIIQFCDNRPQQQLLYVSDLNKCRDPSGLVKFLKEKFSPFGTILSVLVCPDDDGYAYPEGVIKFAYLSEAFAAELALDQNVIGKERLSVTTHHNILLSQCDLRVRLRDAQWCNNAGPDIFSTSLRLTELNTLDEDPVVDPMINLHISSQNIKSNDNESTLNDVSVSYPKENQCTVNFQCPKSKLKYLREISNDHMIHSKKSLSLSGTNINIALDKIESHNTGSNFHSQTFPNVEVNNFSDMHVLRYANSANMLFSDQFEHKSELNKKASEDISIKEDSKIISESGSFVSCDPDPNACTSDISTKIISSNFHSDDLNAVSEYYSSSSMCCKQMSSLQNANDSENKRKFVSSNSKKRRKYFTPSQKLCLKSQRICLTQNAVENTTAKSELSSSTISNMSIKSKKKNSNLYSAISEGTPSMQEEAALLKVTNWLVDESTTAKSELSNSIISNISTKSKKKNLNLYSVTSEGIAPMQEESALLKVNNWLAHIPSSQNITNIKQNYNKETTSVRSVTNMKKQKNRISVHNTPSLKLKNTWGSNSDNSSIENEDLDEKFVILSKEDFQNGDPFHSPLQAWLKQELVLATNNSVIKSQETTKSVILCAAKTKDVIISVGCSHMTCEFCYPESTDLLLGYS